MNAVAAVAFAVNSAFSGCELPGRKITALTLTDGGKHWIAATSNVYRPGHRSRLFRDCVLIADLEGCETLTSPVTTTDGWTYLSSEHCQAVRVKGEKVERLPAGGKDQWSINAFLINDTPYMAVNRDFNFYSFDDGASFVNMLTGKPHFRVKGIGFVRDSFVDRGVQCFTVGWNNGHENIQCLDGRKSPSYAAFGASAGGKTYVGGNMRYGYRYRTENRDASIYELVGTTMVPVHDFGPGTVMDMSSDGQRWCAALVEPARLVIDGELVTGLQQPEGQGGRSFGAVCDIEADQYAFGFSISTREKSYVFTTPQKKISVR